MATRTATLSLILPAAGAEIQLLPAGRFRAADGSGRPEGLEGWYIDAEIAGRIIAAAAARATKFVIDYEHQTFLAEKNGQPAPAAGWFDGRGLQWREGQGLFATQVEWTERARNMIADGEYRYLSPAFTWDDQTGHVLRLVNAGLTNNPGLDGMAAVAVCRPVCNPLRAFPPLRRGAPVNEMLKKLLAALGLAADAGEAAALSAVAALKAKADEVGALQTQIATLRAAPPSQPDPAKFVPVETVQQMQGQIAALSGKLDDNERAGLIEAGLADGRLNPVLTDWAKALPVAQLHAFLEKAPVVPALQGMQSAGGNPAGNTPANPSDADLAVMKALGLSADQFAKGKLER